MTTSLEPIEKTIELTASPAAAFAHFTRGIAKWWPLASHSLGGEQAQSVVLEAREGGRIYELDDAGNEREWGRVQVCEPDQRLVFSWVLERPDLATEVEVRFDSIGEKGCLMTLIHRGWDKRPDGAEWRGNYNSGWDGVLQQYVDSLG